MNVVCPNKLLPWLIANGFGGVDFVANGFTDDVAVSLATFAAKGLTVDALNGFSVAFANGFAVTGCPNGPTAGFTNGFSVCGTVEAAFANGFAAEPVNGFPALDVLGFVLPPVPKTVVNCGRPLPKPVLLAVLVWPKQLVVMGFELSELVPNLVFPASPTAPGLPNTGGEGCEAE